MSTASNITYLKGSTIPIDAPWSTSSNRAAAEHGVRLAYTSASLSPPEQIVWCRGPLELAREIAGFDGSKAPGPSVKSEIFDQPLAKASILAEVFYKELLEAAAEETKQERRVAEAVDHAVSTNVDTQFSRLSVLTRHLWRRLRGLPRVTPRGHFKDIALGPLEFAQLRPYGRIHSTGDREIETHRLAGLSMLAANAGWVVPFEHVCWLSEPPSRVHIDARGRLHCADGPALAYRDGFSFWSWKGVEVPADAILHPEQITIATLDSTFDPVVRRCLIEIMTPERLIASGAARQLSTDDTGTLWGVTWKFHGTTIDEWCAVEVVDGAPGPDGTSQHCVLTVPPHLRTAREAVAWTYGLTGSQYAQLQLRT